MQEQSVQPFIYQSLCLDFSGFVPSKVKAMSFKSTGYFCNFLRKHLEVLPYLHRFRKNTMDCFEHKVFSLFYSELM